MELMRLCLAGCAKFGQSTNNFLLLNNKQAMCRLLSNCSNSSDQSLSCTVQHALKLWSDEFIQRDVAEPDTSAELIIAHVLNRKTLHHVHMQTQLKKCEMDKISELCKLRVARMPVQYIIGEWDFLDLTLKMQPPVLIPRPETEELANFCIESLTATSDKQKETFLEVGVGTGALSISLLKRFEKFHAVALDVASSACQLTEENAILHGVRDRLQIVEGDFFQRQTIKTISENGPYSLVVSNPPYITTEEMRSLQTEIAWYEDPLALDGGHDGLNLIKELLLQSNSLLKKGGHLWLEVAPQHPPIVNKFLKQNGLERSLSFVETVMDMFGKNRFCHFQRL